MIIFRDPNNIEVFESYTTLKALCRCNRWAKYNTLRDKKFPFEYKGFRFDKIKTK